MAGCWITWFLKEVQFSGVMWSDPASGGASIPWDGVEPGDHRGFKHNTHGYYSICTPDQTSTANLDINVYEIKTDSYCAAGTEIDFGECANFYNLATYETLTPDQYSEHGFFDVVSNFFPDGTFLTEYNYLYDNNPNDNVPGASLYGDDDVQDLGWFGEPYDPDLPEGGVVNAADFPCGCTGGRGAATYGSQTYGGAVFFNDADSCLPEADAFLDSVSKDGKTGVYAVCKKVTNSHWSGMLFTFIVFGALIILLSFA